MFTYIKLYRTLFVCILLFFTKESFAQNEAIIMGKIDNPQSFNIEVEYLKNPFTLEKAHYEGNIDLNNLIGLKVSLNEPRAILLKFQNKKIRLFIAPGDTLKFKCDALKMNETMEFEGSNANSNRYLWQFSQRFINHFDEKSVEYYRFSTRPLDFKTYIDTSAQAQQAFYDHYNTVEKASFSTAFKEFAQNDIIYWRFFHLFDFVRDYNLAETESFRKVQNQYFNFVKDISINTDKALNSIYFLHSLNYYLNYWVESNHLTNQLPQPISHEKVSIIQVAQPRISNIPIWENPYIDESRVGKLSTNEEVYSLYSKTEEPVNYKIETNTTINDYFIKIKTNDGVIGWVPQSQMVVRDKEAVENKTYIRYCTNINDASCGFEPLLKGKILSYSILRDILLNTSSITADSMRMRVNGYLNRNASYKQYGDILRGVTQVVVQDRENFMNRLIIPDDCKVEYFNLNQMFFDRNRSFEIGKVTPTETRLTLIPTPESAFSNTISAPELVEYKEGKAFIFKGLSINEDIPTFYLKDINGQPIRQQDLLGKVVFIDFWATWCSPCQAEMTHSQSLIEKYKDNKNIVFLYISVDSDTEAWRNYIKTNQLKGVHTNDEINIPANFMIQGLPNFLIVDKKGRIAYNSRLKSKINADSMIEYLLK